MIAVATLATGFRNVSLPADTPIVVSEGRISGTQNASGDVRIYKGIPFAAPPVGDLRWKAPQPVTPWTGVKACTAFGASPMQGSPAPFGPWSAEFLIPKEPISEDCLYLNVWTPAKTAGKKQPVLVWIYGGGFSSGGSGCAIYDGEATAKKGIVFVSINYRVGPFGFLALPELTKESGHNASGNYGLMDQIAALRWVQKNIAAFGGDPANVTIAGQSAGSMSVNCLVATPLASGLFTKAIAQSGASFTRSNPSLATAEDAGKKWMADLGVSSLTELRAKPAAELMKKYMTVRGPIIDGYVLPGHIADIFNAGKQNKIALLTGWNEDEGMSAVKKPEEFKAQLQQQYGAKAGELATYYPSGTEAESARSQTELSRDQIFGAQNYKWATMASDQHQPVYVYRFTRNIPATGQYATYGAFHTGEVAYAYDNLAAIDKTLRPLDQTDNRLAAQMAGYWANFIKTGNPNGALLPAWPVFSTQRPNIMVLGDNCHPATLTDAARLTYLLSVMTK